MSVTNVHKDPKQRLMAITAEFDAPVDQVWQLWEDPRKLERWWGPPGYPATFTTFEPVPGGRVAYYMTSPEGERHYGWWQFTSIDPPNGLQFDDGFADPDGNPTADMPTIVITVTLAERPEGGTTMTISNVFPTDEAVEQLLEMGMAEGMSAAVSQMDALLEQMAA